MKTKKSKTPAKISPKNDCNWWQRIFWRKKRQFEFEYEVFIGPKIEDYTYVKNEITHVRYARCMNCNSQKIRLFRTDKNNNWEHSICLNCITVMTIPN